MSQEKYGPYTGMEYALFRGALGQNNIAEPHNLKRDEDGNVELAEAVNFEINDDKSISTRPGRFEVWPGQAHSMWAEGRFCFFVGNGNLYRMREDESIVLVFPGVGTGRMSYSLAMDKVYAANGSVQFIVDDTTLTSWNYTPMVQSPSDKRTLGFPAPFDRILWHSSRMFVAKGNVMYQSGLFSPGYFDLEEYLQFTSNIIEWVSVRGGIYLSTAERTIFLPGPDMATFKEEVNVRLVPMVPGTARLVEGHAFGSGSRGQILSWIGPYGETCLGSENGELLEVLDKQVRLEKHSKGGSVFTRGQLIYSLEE